ncbi:hypothetical protein [uncultured Microbacterium sp.]|uniref:hypothetical protein n=1 Tax=uncultured Microbacterium sp. TaxID=191216 RepID=UPI0025EE3011|nr:hypothetical protein [uncultured Microbacterium sp.]
MTTPTLTLRKRTALVAAVALLAIGAGGVAVSGAYFTDQKSIESNSVATSTVKLGPIDGSDGTTKLTVTDLLPLPKDDSKTIADSAKTFQVVVSNTGKATIDWAAAIFLTSAPGTNDKPSAADALYISYSTDGSTWSTGVTLASLLSSKQSGLSGTDLASGASKTIFFRAWLPSTTSNTYQGTSVTFTLRVRAIQTGTAGGINDDLNFVTLAK